MIELLPVLLAVLGAFLVVVLILQIGIIRRLNEHEKLIGGSQGGAKQTPPADLFIPVGTRVENFHKALTAAKPTADTSNPTIVAFLLENCPACSGQLESIQLIAGACRDNYRVNFVAVMIGDESELKPYSDLLNPDDYVIETFGSGLNLALQPAGYPAFALLTSEGVLQTSDWEEIQSLHPAQNSRQEELGHAH